MARLAEPVTDEWPEAFPACTPRGPGGRGHSAEHHESLDTLRDFCTLLGWTTWTPDLGPWGRPDLIASGPGRDPWVIEYKSYRPNPRDLRIAVMQTFGYACNLAPVDRCYLVLGGTGPTRPIWLPDPLDAVQIVSPGQFLVALAEACGVPCDDYPIPGT